MEVREKAGFILTTMNVQHTLRKKQLIEAFSIFFESQHLPPLAGRILGWLMICDPAEQTANGIGSALEMSKGSVSTMTRLLLEMGLVEKISMIGERQYYYRMHPHAIERMLLARQAEFNRLLEIADDGIGVLEREPGADKERLLRLREMCQTINREMPGLIAQVRKAESEYLTAGTESRANVTLDDTDIDQEPVTEGNDHE